MEDNSVPAEDKPALQDVLDALDDPDCRSILREIHEPMTAKELSEICDIPKSTLYRKLDLLSSACLVKEQDTIGTEGRRVTYYERSFNDVMISIDDMGDFSVNIQHRSRSTDKHLVDIWSMMGDEI
jgi:predicted transcriptional regulator